MEINEKKNAISAMMEASMGKIREMVDSNTVVGEPIVTADGVTLIPVSRLSFGFGCGGGDYGKQPDKLGAGAAAGVRVEPYGVSGGQGRRDPHAAVGTPAITTVDRIVEMVPQVMDRVEGFIDKKREKADF